MCDESKMYPLQTFPKFFNFYTESLLSLLITKVSVLDMKRKHFQPWSKNVKDE